MEGGWEEEGQDIGVGRAMSLLVLVQARESSSGTRKGKPG